MKRTTTFLTIALLAIGLSFLLNISPRVKNGMSAVHLTHGDVRGAAISYKGKLYTLGFDQQEALIDMINRSISVGAADLERGGVKPAFEKVILYRFNDSDLILTPILYKSDGNLIYTLPALHPEGYLQDISLGEMKKVLSESYDH